VSKLLLIIDGKEESRTLLYVSSGHVFISLTKFMGIPHSMTILYKTSLLTES